MPKTRHIIRPDVKAQILKRLKEDGVPVARLSEEHGVSTKTIYGWLSRGLATNRPSMHAYERENLKKFVMQERKLKVKNNES